MIAAVSPSSMFYDDTYNTLKYANRAKDIKSSVSMLVFIDLLSSIVIQHQEKESCYFQKIIISLTFVSKFCSVTSSFLESTLLHLSDRCSRYRADTSSVLKATQLYQWHYAASLRVCFVSIKFRNNLQLIEFTAGFSILLLLSQRTVKHVKEMSEQLYKSQSRFVTGRIQLEPRSMELYQ